MQIVMQDAKKGLCNCFVSALALFMSVSCLLMWMCVSCCDVRPVPGVATR